MGIICADIVTLNKKFGVVILFVYPWKSCGRSKYGWLKKFGSTERRGNAYKVSRYDCVRIPHSRVWLLDGCKNYIDSEKS